MVLEPEKGILILDVVNDVICQVEILDREDIRSALDRIALFPPDTLGGNDFCTRLGSVHILGHRRSRSRFKLTGEWLGAPSSSRVEALTKRVC